MDRAEVESNSGMPFPRKVRIAGIGTIVFGCALSSAAGLMLAVKVIIVELPDKLGHSQWYLLGILLGIAIAYSGRQTLRGTAADTLGIAIGSMTGGILFLLVGIVSLIIAVGTLLNEITGPRVLLAAFATVSIVLAGGLALIGLLALAGRHQYREWRHRQNSCKEMMDNKSTPQPS